MINLLVQNQRYYNEIEYVFQYIFKYIYGVEGFFRISTYQGASSKEGDYVISYGTKVYEDSSMDHSQIHIYESSLFGKDFLKKGSMPSLPLRQYDDLELEVLIGEKWLPIIYWGNADLNEPVVFNGRLIQSNMDLIASSFFMLSRYEEIVNPFYDVHGRFPAKASLAYVEGFLERPIVNEYIELLWSWMKRLGWTIERIKLYANKSFSFFLSHDIDHIYKYPTVGSYFDGLKGSMGDLIKRKDLNRCALSLKGLLSSLLKRDPYYNLERMYNLEKDLNIRSSWYFMVDGHDPFDGHMYQLMHVKKIIETLLLEEHEVGLHLSYHTFNSIELMKGEVEKFISETSSLNCPLYGARQHYLRLKIGETWEYLEKCGLLYDCSLGFPDHIGFRGGISYPFRPYHFKDRRENHLWVIPLMVMDGTLKEYMKLRPEQSMGRVRDLIRRVQRYQGVFSLLWHNTSFVEEHREWNEFYIDLLTFMNDDHVIKRTGYEIIEEFMKKRGSY